MKVSVEVIGLKVKKGGYNSWASKTNWINYWSVRLVAFDHSLGVLAKLCMCSPRPSIFCAISCKHADTSTSLHSTHNALFIVFDLFILWLFVPMLQYELNIHSTPRQIYHPKMIFNEIQALQRTLERWILFCTVKTQSTRNSEVFHEVLNAKIVCF